MNQDIIPTMLQYQGEEKELIKQAMVEVKKFQNIIAQNHIRVVEEQLKDILENLQREHHSFVQNLESTIKWINEQIQVVTLMNPQYFQKQMKEKNILLKINLQDRFTLEWYNTCRNQYNNDSWKKYIYDDFVNNELYLEIFPQRQIEQVLRDNDQYIKNELQKLLYTWVNKYQNAQTQLLDIKKSIEKLSSEREQQVMLVIAVNNIELIFMGTQKEERIALNYIILQIKLACVEKIKVYFQQHGAIKFDGNFTERVFQEEKHFNFEKDFHDQTYDLIQNRIQMFQDQSQSYFEVCKKLITLFGQLSRKLFVEEQKMTQAPSEYQFPRFQDQLIILTSTNKNQFIILKSQKKLISVNLFGSFSQEQEIESYCMEVPLPVLEYFVQSKILLVLIIKAFELGDKILDLEILNKIYQDESVKIQRSLIHQQNLYKQEFQINLNIRSEGSLSDDKKPLKNQLISPLLPGILTFNNNNPKEQSQITRQSSLNSKHSYPMNQNTQQQMIIQNPNNVNDMDQLDIEELKKLLLNDKNRKEVQSRIKKVLKPLIVEIMGGSKEADLIGDKLTNLKKFTLEQMIKMTKDHSQLKDHINQIQVDGVNSACLTF